MGRDAPCCFIGNRVSNAAIRQRHARAQTPFAAKTIQHARNRARVATQLGGFTFEAVDFFDDFNRHEDGVLFEIDE